MTSFVVWWTNQEESEEVCTRVESGTWNAPEYIKDMVISRQGRNGRGRLWIGKIPEFDGIEAINWNDDKPLASYIGARCGGILVKLEDMFYLRNVRGLITDENLERMDVMTLFSERYRNNA